MDEHPVGFDVDYPDRDLNRLTTAFRIFTVIPIAIVLGSVVGYSTQYDAGGDTAGTVVVGGVGLLVFPPLLMILSARNTHAGGSTGTSSCFAS